MSAASEAQKSASAQVVGLMFQLNQAILSARSLGVTTRVSLINGENQEEALVTTRGLTLDELVPLT